MQPLRTLAVALLAGLSLAAAPPAAQQVWNNVVVATPQGSHLIGNPAAPVKLVEYVSYTCPHCAHFELQADAPLRLSFIATGKGSIEYRPFLRNKIDVAVSLLVGCGPASKFRGNQSLVLRSQEKWFTPVTRAQEQRWESPDFGSAMRAIASDLKLYDLMERRGYSQVELDRCLSNRTAADKLAEMTHDAVEKFKVDGTPGFLVNGELQQAHDWEGLRPRLAELTR